MTQVAVDLATQNLSLPNSSHKRKHFDGDSSLDEDPSWQPSDFKPKKKRRSRDARMRNHHVPVVSPPSPGAGVLSSPYSCASSRIEVELCNDELWEEFRPLGTEMVICKEGRRMFPAVEIAVKGLQPDFIYSIYISVRLRDNCRYRYYTDAGWKKINTGVQSSIPYRMIPHRESRNTGAHFMRKPLSFKTIKMTNKLNTTRDDQLILLSMRSYEPVITVHCHTIGEDIVHHLSNCDFIAVTSYQREEVTKMKIETNQFAAAFRKRTKTPPEENNKSGESDPQPASNSSQDMEDTSYTPSPESHTHSDDSVMDTPDYQACNNTLVQPGHKAGVPDVLDSSGPELLITTQEEPSLSTTCSMEDVASPISSDDNDDNDDDDQCFCLDESRCANGYTDIPAHIRPFLFQPQYHCGLHRCMGLKLNCPPQLPKCSGIPDQQSLWSSAALPGSFSVGGHNISAGTDCFNLGLISDFLSL